MQASANPVFRHLERRSLLSGSNFLAQAEPFSYKGIIPE
jgi:hypothetical protein